MQARAPADPKIHFAWNSAATELHGDPMPTGATPRDTATDEPRQLNATGLFIATGHDPRTELSTRQPEMDEQGYLKAETPSTPTSLPGIFGAGDTTAGTDRQAITTAGSDCQAALDAKRYLAALGAATVRPAAPASVQRSEHA